MKTIEGLSEYSLTRRRTGWGFRETSPYLLQHAYHPVDWYPFDQR